MRGTTSSWLPQAQHGVYPIVSMGVSNPGYIVYTIYDATQLNFSCKIVHAMRKTSKSLDIMCSFCNAISHLQDPCKILVESCTCKESGRKCPFSCARSCSSCKTVLAGYVTSYLYFPTTGEIQALKLLVSVPRSIRESTQILRRSKVINI